MAFTLPRLIQIPSPNWSERNPPRVDLVVIHDCEGSYEGSINVFLDPHNNGNPVSAHFVLSGDGTTCAQMVPLSKKAWHACSFNSRSVGVEMAGFSKNGFPQDELMGDASIVAWLLRHFGLPCRWAKGGQGMGFTSHYDLGAAGGGHSDPTTSAALWQGYIDRITAAYNEYMKGPPVSWALDNLAPPAMHSPPPSMPTGFVPSGTARKD